MYVSGTILISSDLARYFSVKTQTVADHIFESLNTYLNTGKGVILDNKG